MDRAVPFGNWQNGEEPKRQVFSFGFGSSQTFGSVPSPQETNQRSLKDPSQQEASWFNKTQEVINNETNDEKNEDKTLLRSIVADVVTLLITRIFFNGDKISVKILHPKKFLRMCPPDQKPLVPFGLTSSSSQSRLFDPQVLATVFYELGISPDWQEVIPGIYVCLCENNPKPATFTF
jgi:hypothetical protein